MAFFIVLAMVGFLAISALLWCFGGFTRELRQGRKTVGLLVRVEKADAKESPGENSRRNIRNVVELTRSQLRAVHLTPRRSTHVPKAK